MWAMTWTEGRSCCSWSGCLGYWNPLPPQGPLSSPLPWEATVGAQLPSLPSGFWLDWVPIRKSGKERSGIFYSPGCSFLGGVTMSCLPARSNESPPGSTFPAYWVSGFLFFFPSFSLGGRYCLVGAVAPGGRGAHVYEENRELSSLSVPPLDFPRPPQGQGAGASYSRQGRRGGSRPEETTPSLHPKLPNFWICSIWQGNSKTF